MDMKDKLRILHLVTAANMDGYLEAALQSDGESQLAGEYQEKYLEARREIRKILGLSE